MESKLLVSENARIAPFDLELLNMFYQLAKRFNHLEPFKSNEGRVIAMRDDDFKAYKRILNMPEDDTSPVGYKDVMIINKYGDAETSKTRSRFDGELSE